MEFDHRKRYASTSTNASHDAPVPGKQTLTQGMVQMHPAAPPRRVPSGLVTVSPPLPVPSGPRPTLQMLFGRRGPASDPEQVHAAAARGTATAASQLPHLEQIQRSFGKHDVGHVQAHVGADAAASAQEMGAAAYATGNHVVLGAGTDLHTVAHEAAHVVQQRAGVHLKGGVGEAADIYERHADAVADHVVQGKSAEHLLDAMSATTGAAAPGVQRKDTPDKPATTALTPEAGAVRESESGRDLNGQKIWAEAIISSGKLYKKTGEVDGRKAKAEQVDGKVIYVLSPEGTVYLRSEPHGVPRPDEFTHANFLSGTPVGTAGQMFVRGGQVTRLDNESGHYKPGEATLEWMLQTLHGAGVELSETLLVMLGPGGYTTYNAKDYMDSEEPAVVPDQIRTDDEDYQKQYDAHIGRDVIRFGLFGWPYGKLRPNEWQPQIGLVKERLAKGGPVSVEIEHKLEPSARASSSSRGRAATGASSSKARSTGEKKDAATADETMRKLFDEIHAEEIGRSEVAASGSSRAFTRFMIIRKLER